MPPSGYTSIRTRCTPGRTVEDEPVAGVGLQPRAGEERHLAVRPEAGERGRRRGVAEEVRRVQLGEA